MSYKLTYFDGEGRGEPARLIFVAAGVKFNDNRIKHADWPAVKESMGGAGVQLPVLQVGDKTLTQSMAIFRFLGRKFKLAGSDDWEAAKCDELVDATSDIMEPLIDYIFKEQDPEKKEEKKKTYISQTLPTYLARLNKIQMENGGTWLVGKNMTWADIVIAEFLRAILERSGADPSVVDKYPQVRKLKEAVDSNPQIKEYRGRKK